MFKLINARLQEVVCIDFNIKVRKFKIPCMQNPINAYK